MLYVVSTPIGNMEDITHRALSILNCVDYVLAEDTRRTAKLLLRHDIKNKLVSYNDHNKEKKTPRILEDLRRHDIALVSDAGSPGISDPGFYLIRACIKKDIVVSPVPGPSAILAGLVCSGLPTDRFTFYGFFPKKKSGKKNLINLFKKRLETAVFFESPHRIASTVSLLSKELPYAEVVIARELTKKFEEFIRGPAKDVHETIKGRKIKGELVIILKVGKPT